MYCWPGFTLDSDWDATMPTDDSHLAMLEGGGRGALVTLKGDGRPQLSNLDFSYEPDKRMLRMSTTDDRSKIVNLRRDPRASFYVANADLSAYLVVEGTAELSAIASDPRDATTEELIDVYRAIQGEHPDWDDYRSAMVADGRLVVRLTVEHHYGWTPPR